LRIDLYADHRELTSLVMAADGASADASERVDNWMSEHPTAVNRYRKTLVEIRSTSTDLTVLLVAAREVRNLIGRTSTTL
jgi:NAD-specific glutamate dehydrogenase